MNPPRSDKMMPIIHNTWAACQAILLQRHRPMPTSSDIATNGKRTSVRMFSVKPATRAKAATNADQSTHTAQMIARDAGLLWGRRVTVEGSTPTESGEGRTTRNAKVRAGRMLARSVGTRYGHCERVSGNRIHRPRRTMELTRYAGMSQAAPGKLRLTAPQSSSPRIRVAAEAVRSLYAGSSGPETEGKKLASTTIQELERIASPRATAGIQDHTFGTHNRKTSHWPTPTTTPKTNDESQRRAWPANGLILPFSELCQEF